MCHASFPTFALLTVLTPVPCAGRRPLSHRLATSVLSAPLPQSLLAERPSPWHRPVYMHCSLLRTPLLSVQSPRNLALSAEPLGSLNSNTVQPIQPPATHQPLLHNPCSMGHGSPMFPFFSEKPSLVCDSRNHSSQHETMRVPSWRCQAFGARMAEHKDTGNLGTVN